jgi:hypothetical protein
MAKKKTIGKFELGAKVRVKPGIVSPEFPDFSLAGWVGTVSEVANKQPPVKLLIEWDAATLSAMPSEYLARCEKDGLYYRMICLSEDDIEGT